MTDADFAHYYALLDRRIHARALYLADGDYDLADELEQSGRCALWRLEVKAGIRYPVAYLWRAVRNSMNNTLTQESRASYPMLWRSQFTRSPKDSCLSTVPQRRGVPRHLNAGPLLEERKNV